MTTSTLTSAPPIPRLRLIHYEPSAVADHLRAKRAGPSSFGLRPVQPGELAQPPGDQDSARRLAARHAVAQQLRLALEVLDGRRPLTHLAGNATPEVLRFWRAAVRQRKVLAPSRFSRLHLCLIGETAAETATTCHIDGRARALAARFERVGARWLCTAIRLG